MAICHFGYVIRINDTCQSTKCSIHHGYQWGDVWVTECGAMYDGKIQHNCSQYDGYETSRETCTLSIRQLMVVAAAHITIAVIISCMCNVPKFPLLEKVARKSFILGISKYNIGRGDATTQEVRVLGFRICN